MDNLYILEYGLSPPEIKLELHDGMPLSFFTKDQFGYYMFKEFSTKYGGFRQLKITIPKKLYTTSLNPKGQNRILKITKDNIDKYKEFIKNYLSNDPTLYKYISKKNIIGLVDMRFGEEHVNGKLWEFPDIIKFEKTEIIYSKKPTPKPKPKLKPKANIKTKTKNQSRH